MQTHPSGNTRLDVSDDDNGTREVELPSPIGAPQFDWTSRRYPEAELPTPYSDDELEERARKIVESEVDTDPPPYDVIDPLHYRTHPAGVECITVIEHMNYNIGASIKYLWRHGLKPGTEAETDLRKSMWHIQRELHRLGRLNEK